MPSGYGEACPGAFSEPTMKKRFLIAAVLTLTLILQTGVALAFETDQYNLPPQPLADIGEEVTEYVIDNLENAITVVNKDIVRSKNCLANKKTRVTHCSSAETERKTLARLLSADAITDELYRSVGDGSLLVTKFGKWMRSHKFRAQPASYKPGYKESIFVALPSNYLTISPTIRMYGVEFGVDKLEHLFQQGYEYHKIRLESLADGQKPEKAVEKAILWGQKTERTYFGTLVSGVFSNGDLYANYAGMKFYQGLTAGLEINGVRRPPMVTFNDDKWKVARNSILREWLLQPFITEHMNEALNPSGYTLILIRSIRRTIKKNSCPEWHRQYPMLSKAALKRKTLSLQRWNDEDYGFTRKKRMIDLAEMCFSDNPTASSKQ